jgi:hypothetical protein
VIGTPTTQYGGDNSTFREPVFQSAPSLQPGNQTRPHKARKTASSRTTNSLTGWPNDK